MGSIVDILLMVVVFVGLGVGATIFYTGTLSNYGMSGEEVSGISNTTYALLQGDIADPLEETLSEPTVSKEDWADVPTALITGAWTGAKLIFTFPDIVGGSMTSIAQKEPVAKAVIFGVDGSIGIYSIVFLAITIIVIFLVLSAAFKWSF